ncbi:MAG: hypothetical protein IKQ87_00945 [Clostridia bacterium]|nr:hypothetical protein [Clostridia bacterium]
MKWMLRFKFARPREGEGDGCVAVLADCAEDELQGVKEARLMELEKKTGRTRVCVEIVKMIRKGGVGL